MLKHISLKRVLSLMLAALILTGCGSHGQSPVTQDPSAVDTTSPDPNAPDPAYPSDKYLVMSKEEYLDKTTAGFLGQLAGFLSGYEFVTSGSDRCRVGMPDSWYEYLNGPYAGNYTYKNQTDKFIKNKSTGIYEVWFDDDFSVDVVNQYIISDMYRQARTVSEKFISDGWLKYDVWDMGGGQRKVGAYGLVKRYNYLPQFAGNTEYGNWYSYCTEAYLGSDTIGMNAPGMPDTACELSGIFAQITGDRDNVLWAQMFSTMISLGYFEKDIDTIIKKASEVFADGSYPLELIDYIYSLREKYPDDWRAAYKELENKYYIHDTRNTNTNVNCSFVILDLLYGEGDYEKTCKIGSLAGYDCESTTGIALALLGVIGGMDILPEKTNELIWQNGEGILTNLTEKGLDEGLWMIAAGLPERIKISSVIDKYRQNFESILKEAGGAIDEKYYYIPIEELRSYTCGKLQNPDFETGTLDGYTVTGKVSVDSKYPTKGLYTAKLEGNSEMLCTVSGLQAGADYTFTAFVRTSSNATAYLIARDKGATGGTCTSVHQTVGTPKYEAQSTVKRTLHFTATASEMEVGIILDGAAGEYAFADSLVVIKTEESSVGTVTVKNQSSDNKYQNTLTMTVNSTTTKQAYLKLKFSNENSDITNLEMTLNSTQYFTAPLYKTHDRANTENAHYVYIPIVLLEGDNLLRADFNGKQISIHTAELVVIDSRFAN